MVRHSNRLVLLLILIALVAASGYKSLSGDIHNGMKQADIAVFTSESGGERVLFLEDVDIRFNKGLPSNLGDYISDFLLRSGSVWVEIEGDDVLSDGGRYEFSGERTLRRESPAEGSEIEEDMSIEMRIGNPGEDFMVESDRTGFGDPAPNERVTVAGAMSMQGLGSTPTAESGYGKVFVDDSNGHLMYVKEDGAVTDLTVDGNAVQSVSSSANPTGRTEHMRFIPGEMTEITESATNDTIYIRYDLSMSSTGCSSAPSQPDPIDGITPICSGEPGTSYGVAPVDGASYYRWTVPSGATISYGFGTNIIHAILGDNDGDICVKAVNSCGESPSRCFGVTINRPTAPGSISGDFLVCNDTTGLTYNIAAVPEATSYIWTVPPGAVITGGTGTNEITVNFGTTDGEICVQTENSCGRSEAVCASIVMTETPATPGLITGPTSICESTSGSFSIASVPEATSYVWTVPSGASVISGAGTESVDVLFGSSSGNVCVSAQSICGTSSSRCSYVTVQLAPVITSNPSNQTVEPGGNATFTVSATGTGLSYQWQQSTNGGATWTNIGSSTSSHTLYSVTEGMDGYDYRCIVSGSCSPSATSASANLEVVAHGNITFTYTGNYQTWSVPFTGTYTLECWGAQGGSVTSYYPSTGGYGGYARGSMSLTAGQTLYIYVGGKGADRPGNHPYSSCTYVAGGFNGGGANRSAGNGSPGGGASDIRVGSTSLYNRVIVGAGGAGCGWQSTAGGAGGGTTGNTGASCSGTGGRGGTQSAGGAAGTASGSCGITSGSFGLGGNGSGSSAGGGGGGGGWYGGGGGGYCNGGGGGSSYTTGLSSATTSTGVRSGNGQVIISW